MAEYIPEDLMSNIFSRLSVKSLLRFRCVSKSVCALIDSSYFINSHLHHTIRTNSCTTIITNSVARTHGLHYKKFDSLDQPETKINHPLEHCWVKILGCCNGLICLVYEPMNDFICIVRQFNFDVVLVNPATRKHILLPASFIEYRCCRSQTACESIDFVYGFGYNPVKDDYNVMQIVQCRPNFKSQVKIYSLKLHQWRSKEFPYRLTSTTPPVFVDGALNWLVHSCDFEDVMIASFDLETEEYRLIEPPGYPTTGYMGILGVVGRKLCIQLINYDKRHFTIWVRENYGVKEPWTKLLSLVHDVDIESLKPLAYSNDGKKFLLEIEGKLAWIGEQDLCLAPPILKGPENF